MPDRLPLVRRRAVLSGAVAVALLSGCDSGEDIEPPGGGESPPASGEASPSTSEAPDQTPDQSPGQTPDEALVDEVGAALLAAVGVLRAARRTGLRATATPLLRAHQRHLAVLEVEDATAPPALDAAAALREVRRSEHALHATLVAGASRAESGALARLLASMSASVTQHLAVLPTEVAP